MAWKFIGDPAGEGYPGLPFEDLSDEDMAAAVADIEPRFVDTHGKIADCGKWEQVQPAGKGGADPPAAPPAPAGPDDVQGTPA
jgi:hypothetical protein